VKREKAIPLAAEVSQRRTQRGGKGLPAPYRRKTLSLPLGWGGVRKGGGVAVVEQALPGAGLLDPGEAQLIRKKKGRMPLSPFEGGGRKIVAQVPLAIPPLICPVPRLSEAGG